MSFPFDPIPGLGEFGTEALGWARLALTGSKTSTTPTDEDLTPFLEGASADLIARHPDCLTGAPGSLSGADVNAWNEAVGYLVASRYVLTPGGQKWAAFVVSNKQGPVTKVYQGVSSTPAQASQYLSGAAGTAIVRIECIRTALASRETPSFFGLAGRRRSRGCGCGGH